MTVRDLIKELEQFAPDAEVHIDIRHNDTILEIDSVTASEDAPDEDVYLEVVS